MGQLPKHWLVLLDRFIYDSHADLNWFEPRVDSFDFGFDRGEPIADA